MHRNGYAHRRGYDLNTKTAVPSCSRAKTAVKTVFAVNGEWNHAWSTFGLRDVVYEGSSRKTGFESPRMRASSGGWQGPLVHSDVFAVRGRHSLAPLLCLSFLILSEKKILCTSTVRDTQK
eukprot:4961348-Amphidinium_carterae.1